MCVCCAVPGGGGGGGERIRRGYIRNAVRQLLHRVQSQLPSKPRVCKTLCTQPRFLSLDRDPGPVLCQSLNYPKGAMQNFPPFVKPFLTQGTKGGGRARGGVFT